jgi:hypothetical protein
MSGNQAAEEMEIPNSTLRCWEKQLEGKGCVEDEHIRSLLGNAERRTLRFSAAINQLPQWL